MINAKLNKGSDFLRLFLNHVNACFFSKFVLCLHNLFFMIKILLNLKQPQSLQGETLRLSKINWKPVQQSNLRNITSFPNLCTDKLC